MSFYPGMTIRLRAIFLRRVGPSGDYGGFESTPFAPDSLAIAIKDPSGDVIDVTGSAESPSVGHYYVDYTPDAAGKWFIRWSGEDSDSGALGVAESSFGVAASDVI